MAKKPLLYGPTGRPIKARARENAGTWDTVWEAAKRSGYRGYFYFPTLSPTEQMPESTRTVVAKKTDWLYKNLGCISAVIDGLGLDEVDTGLWPKARTSNAAFNKRATDLFHHGCKEPRVFHSAAVENFYSAQWLVRRSIRLYGDHFGQLLRPGEGSAVPQLHFIPSWQVTDPEKDGADFRDGVRRNRLGRAVEYNVRTNEGDRRVPAGDMLHFHDKFLTGQSRGMPALSSVVRKLFTLDDIEKAESNGTLLRTRLAYAITSKGEDEAAPRLLPGVEAVEDVPSPQVDPSPGAKSNPRTFIQKIMSRDGADIDVADLPPGTDISVIESAKDSAAIGHNNYLLADVGHCTLYPPEYIFFVAGMSQGTVARLVQNRAQRVANAVREFQLIPQFCSRWYVYWLWQMIKLGGFDDVDIPPDWYMHGIITPRDMTVDFGREGRVYDERYGTGKMSGARYHGMNGEDSEDVEDEVIDEAIRRRKKLADKAREAGIDLSYEEVFRPPTGSASVVQGAAQKNSND